MIPATSAQPSLSVKCSPSVRALMWCLAPSSPGQSRCNGHPSTARATRFASSKMRRRKHYRKSQAIVRGYTGAVLSAIYGADGKGLPKPKPLRATTGVSHGT